VFADRAVIEQAFTHTGLSIKIREVHSPDDFQFTSDTLQLMSGGIIRKPVRMGKINGDCGRSVLHHVSEAIHWAMKGWVDAVATAPLQKESLQQGESPYLDHTAMFKALTHSDDATTLFMVDRLRVFFLTRHISLRDVADAITENMLLDAVPRCLQYLERLGLERPTLAVAALNPHGGEDGLFGTEERETIIPAVEKAKSAGYRVVGPIPGDSVFHLAKEGAYDGVLSLYHDQGHIAAKTLDFYRTISLTMGLPFLRTSVDHGTAFDIAGKNEANETSMIEAIQCAVQYGPMIKNSVSAV
jgi:4-hydroxythreonine-4-phosphate dehydrogenase